MLAVRESSSLLFSALALSAPLSSGCRSLSAPSASAIVLLALLRVESARSKFIWVFVTVSRAVSVSFRSCGRREEREEWVEEVEERDV